MLARPHENCYWVSPGRLLAGEYPAVADAAATRRRLRALLDARVLQFIDLTHAHELPAYAPALQAEAELRGLLVRHHRMPIRDHDLPESASWMGAILDRIDAALVADQGVYVHCHAGVGRTGTVIGCWLVRHGATGEQALHTLAQLWRRVAKSWRHERTPETDAQCDYVLRWGRDGAR